jgi:hypothetical protein
VGEPIVDADGTSSADWGTDADVDVVCGDPLASWPTGGDAEGIDWFDNDGDCLWSAGDDIHVEGAAFPGANRDGWHDDNANGDGFWNDGEDIVMDANGDWIFD